MERWVTTILNDLKYLLVYFESYNRFLYRYNGFVIMKKFFFASFPDGMINEVFDFVCDSRCAGLATIVLQHPRSDAIFLNESLEYYSRVGYVEIVSVLLKDSRVDPTIYNNAAMIMAARKNHHGVLKLFLQDGRADTNAFDFEDILFMVEQNCFESIVLLIENPQFDIMDFLNIAQDIQNYDMIDFLTKIKEK